MIMRKIGAQIGKLRRAAVGLAAMMIASVPAHAATTVYTTQASYLAAISTPGVDTYNDLPAALVNSPIVRSAGAYSYTASVPDGFFPAGGSADRWLSTNVSGNTVTFDSFSAGVRGIGGFFFGTDINGNFTNTPATLNFFLTDASGTITQALTGTTTSTFLGFVSDGPLTSLLVSSSPTNPETFVWPTINNLTLGAAAAPVVGAVPEPATWAMMLLGFGVVGIGLRRRRKIMARVSFAA